MGWFFSKKKKGGEFKFKLDQLPLSEYSLWKLDDKTLFDYLDELVQIVKYHGRSAAENVVISIERIIHIFRYRYDPRDEDGFLDGRYFLNDGLECPFVEVAIDLNVYLFEGGSVYLDSVQFSNWIKWLEVNIPRYRAAFPARHQRTPKLV